MTDGTMGKFELDALESRSLLSAAPVSLAPGLVMDTGAVIQPLAMMVHPLVVTLAKIAGNYGGTVAVTGVHSRPVKVTLKQAANGTLSGTLTSPQDASIKVKITGKVTSKTAFTFKLSNGSHAGGAIAGSGTGTVKGKTLSITMTFVQGGQSGPGKLTLKLV